MYRDLYVHICLHMDVFGVHTCDFMSVCVWIDMKVYLPFPPFFPHTSSLPPSVYFLLLSPSFYPIFMLILSETWLHVIRKHKQRQVGK